MAEERDFRRRQLLGKYTIKMLYGWNNRKFEEKYVKNLERNQWEWKSVSLEEKSWRGGNVRVEDDELNIFYFYFLFNFIFHFYFLDSDLAWYYTWLSQNVTHHLQVTSHKEHHRRY